MEDQGQNATGQKMPLRLNVTFTSSIKTEHNVTVNTSMIPSH